MGFALNLSADGRVLSATLSKYAPETAVIVSQLPEGDLSHYRYVEGVFLYDPVAESPEVPTLLDRIQAQLVYTAMMTDTLLEA